MKVIGFSGYSGAGKTTLVEKVIGCLKQAGQRVAVVKHAHHAFDIDQEGKDSWRHRRAGAFEVVISSDRRMAKIREFERLADPTVHRLIAEVDPSCDWVLVEGFKRAAIPKLEVWRAAAGHPASYPTDANVIAVCTDRPRDLPVPTSLPVLDLNDAQGVADFLFGRSAALAYTAPSAGP